MTALGRSLTVSRQGRPFVLFAVALLITTAGCGPVIRRHSGVSRYEDAAHRIVKAYSTYGVDPQTGLARLHVDMVSNRAQNSEGDPVADPAAQALYIAMLELMLSYSEQSGYSEQLKWALSAAERFHRDDMTLVPYDFSSQSQRQHLTEHSLWEWWGTPLGTPQVLYFFDSLIRTYESYQQEVVTLPCDGDICYAFAAGSFRVQETEIWHALSVAQQFLYSYQVTENPKYLTWGKNLLDTWWKVRNRTTNLTIDWLHPNGSRARKLDIISYWPLLDAHTHFFLVTHDKTYLEHATAFADALIAYAYDPRFNSFRYAVDVHGVPIAEAGMNGNRIPEYDESQTAAALLRLHMLTGRREYLDVSQAIADKWAQRSIQTEDIGIGMLYSTSAGRAFTIHLLLDLALVTGDSQWTQKAWGVADDILANYMTPQGFIRYDRASNLFWAESAYIVPTALLRLENPARHTYRSRMPPSRN